MISFMMSAEETAPPPLKKSVASSLVRLRLSWPLVEPCSRLGVGLGLGLGLGSKG